MTSCEYVSMNPANEIMNANQKEADSIANVNAGIAVGRTALLRYLRETNQICNGKFIIDINRLNDIERETLENYKGVSYIPVK